MFQSIDSILKEKFILYVKYKMYHPFERIPSCCQFLKESLHQSKRTFEYFYLSDCLNLMKICFI